MILVILKKDKFKTLAHTYIYLSANSALHLMVMYKFWQERYTCVVVETIG